MTGKIKKFAKEHKKELIMVGVGAAAVGAGVYLVYRSGYSAGVSSMTATDQSTNMILKALDGGKYALTGDLITKGGGMHITHVFEHDQAVQMATDILKHAGCLKEVLDVGEKVVEVAANG